MEQALYELSKDGTVIQWFWELVDGVVENFKEED